MYDQNFIKREDFFIVDSDDFYWFEPAAKRLYSNLVVVIFWKNDFKVTKHKLIDFYKEL